LDQIFDGANKKSLSSAERLLYILMLTVINYRRTFSFCILR